MDKQLVETGLIRDLVARIHGDTIEERFYELDYVYRIFRGIIARNHRLSEEMTEGRKADRW